VGAEDLALSKKVIAALEAQLAKEKNREKEVINDYRIKFIENALYRLRSRLSGPPSPEDSFQF